MKMYAEIKSLNQETVVNFNNLVGVHVPAWHQQMYEESL